MSLDIDRLHTLCLEFNHFKHQRQVGKTTKLLEEVFGELEFSSRQVIVIFTPHSPNYLRNRFLELYEEYFKCMPYRVKELEFIVHNHNTVLINPINYPKSNTIMFYDGYDNC